MIPTQAAEREAGRMNRVMISTPGRICLFGEHQDYLHLPVIPAAISLRVTIDGIRRPDEMVLIQLPDIDSAEMFSVKGDLPYTRDRDYFRSGVNVIRRHGGVFSNGFDVVVHGTIPINAGTSSSSALVVGWMNFLSRMSEVSARSTPVTPEQCARLAVEAEVLEFGEPGGMMDQYSTAIGGLLFLDFRPEAEPGTAPEAEVVRLPAKLKSIVLGDSGEEKNTKEILARVKDRVLAIAGRLVRADPAWSLHRLTSEEVGRHRASLDDEQFSLLSGTVRNHEITMEAKSLLQNEDPDDRRLGNLLNEHQAILRDVLNISTTKIDRMLDAAMHAGAYGGKINGSGGGGCMFAYAPDNPERVAEAVTKAGGKAYIVTIDKGTRCEAEERS